MNNTLLYAITVLIWGSTWLAIEFQLGVVAPEVSVTYRYLLAAALLFVWCLTQKKSLRFDLKSHLFFLGLGLLLFCINYIAAYLRPALHYLRAERHLFCLHCLDEHYFKQTLFWHTQRTGGATGSCFGYRRDCGFVLATNRQHQPKR